MGITVGVGSGVSSGVGIKVGIGDCSGIGVGVTVDAEGSLTAFSGPLVGVYCTLSATGDMEATFVGVGNSTDSAATVSLGSPSSLTVVTKRPKASVVTCTLSQGKSSDVGGSSHCKDEGLYR